MLPAIGVLFNLLTRWKFVRFVGRCVQCYMYPPCPNYFFPRACASSCVCLFMRWTSPEILAQVEVQRTTGMVLVDAKKTTSATTTTTISTITKTLCDACLPAVCSDGVLPADQRGPSLRHAVHRGEASGLLTRHRHPQAPTTRAPQFYRAYFDILPLHQPGSGGSSIVGNSCSLFFFCGQQRRR